MGSHRELIFLDFTMKLTEKSQRFSKKSFDWSMNNDYFKKKGNMKKLGRAHL